MAATGNVKCEKNVYMSERQDDIPKEQQKNRAGAV